MDKGGKLKMNGMKVFFVLFALTVLFASGCNKKDAKQETSDQPDSSSAITQQHKIEFVELGSVNCIPCRQMQPVMSSIEKKYKGLVKVTFHDVWKDNAPAKKYGINLIPTQVFLDKNGNELMRHEGFFAEEEIDKFLVSRGIFIPD